MTPQEYEVAYAAALDRLCQSEGKTGKLPKSNPEYETCIDDDKSKKIIKAIKSGVDKRLAISEHLSMPVKTLEYRLGRMRYAGMIEFVGNKWRVK